MGFPGKGSYVAGAAVEGRGSGGNEGSMEKVRMRHRLVRENLGEKGEKCLMN